MKPFQLLFMLFYDDEILQSPVKINLSNNTHGLAFFYL